MTSKERLANEVLEQFTDAYVSKDKYHQKWMVLENYYDSEGYRVSDPDSPNSHTPVVAPMVDAIVADLANSPVEIILQGWGRGEREIVTETQVAVEWVWRRNDLDFKLIRFEYDRVKLGTGVWKVVFDGNVGTSGMPIIEPVSPFNAYPDPRIRDHYNVGMGEYFIHAVPRTISYLRRVPQYADAAKRLKQGGGSWVMGDYIVSPGTSTYSSDDDTVVVLERWSIERDGHLRKVVTVHGQPVVLYDSDDDPEHKEFRREGYYKIDRIPFVVVPMYERRGHLWGAGVAERVSNVEDIVNDLDDQIRLNARLMGNIQKVIGVDSGIDPFTWTNAPGLAIPAREPREGVGWQIVRPPELPRYILERRNLALTWESQFITGQTDVALGQRTNQRTASGIMVLIEAAGKRAALAKKYAQWGLQQVVSLVLDYVAEYWTDDVEIGEELLFRGSKLKEVPVYGPGGKQKFYETGEPVTRQGRFDITVNVGQGMPVSKAFIYQACIEGVQYGWLTREEARNVLKQVLNFPLIQPYSPVGSFVGGSGGTATSETLPGRAQEVAEQLLAGLASGKPMTPIDEALEGIV